MMQIRLHFRSIGCVLLRVGMLVLALGLPVNPAAAQGSGEGTKRTTPGTPPEAIIITTKPSATDLVYVGIGPIVGGVLNFSGSENEDSFLGELKGKIPEADLSRGTPMIGYGGSLRIDAVAKDFELGVYGLWGSNAHEATTQINNIGYIRKARMDVHETVGSLAYNFGAPGNSLLHAGLGIGGGVYRLELIQAPRTGGADPIVDESFSSDNPLYFDRRLTATYLVLVPHLQWQLLLGTEYLRLQTTVGFRSVLDVGPWRDGDENIRFDLPRTGSFGVFGSITLAVGYFTPPSQ